MHYRSLSRTLAACAVVVLLLLAAPAADAVPTMTVNGVTFEDAGLVTHSVHHVLVQAVPATDAAVEEGTLAAIRAALEVAVADELRRGGLEFIVNVTEVKTMPSSYAAGVYIAKDTVETIHEVSTGDLKNMKGLFSMGNGRGGTLFTVEVVQLLQGYVAGGTSSKSVVTAAYNYTALEINGLVYQCNISGAVTAAGGSGTYIVEASRLQQKEGFSCYSACKGMIAMAAVIAACMIAVIVVFAAMICCCWTTERVRRASTVHPITDEQEFFYEDEERKSKHSHKPITPLEGIEPRQDTSPYANEKDE